MRVGAAPEPEGGGDLIVPRASCVNATSGIAEFCDELPLDQRVDVLVGRVGLNADPPECVLDLYCLVRRDDPLPAEHAHVRLGGSDVVGQQPTIHVERLRQREDVGMQPTLEPPAPERSACLGAGHALPSRRA